MVFATLVNDLKMIYLIITGWNHVGKTYGTYQLILWLLIKLIKYSILWNIQYKRFDL